MNEIVKTTLIGLFFGTFGTTIGGIIGTKFKHSSNKLLSFVLAFASGLMIAIVCFDLLPEAFNLSNLPTAFLGIILGIVAMIFCDMLVDKKYNLSEETQLLKILGFEKQIFYATNQLKRANEEAFGNLSKICDQTINYYDNTKLIEDNIKLHR